MRSTVTINIDLLNKLKRSKDVYKYSTMQDLLSAMNNFFIENGLRPDEKVNYHLTSSIQEIKTDFKNRDDSLRRWIGKISHVDLSSIHKDLNIIKEYLAFKIAESVKENVEIFVQKEKEESNVSVPNIDLEKQIEEQRLKDERHENVIESKNKIIQNYHTVISELMKNMTTGRNPDVVYLGVDSAYYQEIKSTIL